MKIEHKRANAELEYRLAHACYILSNFCLSEEEKRYRLLEEGYLPISLQQLKFHSFYVKFLREKHVIIL